MTQQEEMASHCARRRLDWILGQFFFLPRGLSSIGTGCPRKGVESPFLEVSKRRIYVVFRDVVGLGSAELMVRLDDVKVF